MAKLWYPSKRMPIQYKCSNGKTVTQDQINRKRSEAYRERYAGNQNQTCEGCGKKATCSAHIISQARCKQLHKTELIWDFNNFFPACFKCNQAIENPKGEAWKLLNNKKKCVEFIFKHDKELYLKFILNAINDYI